MSNVRRLNQPIKIGTAAADPVDSDAGILYFNTADDILKFRNSTEYKTVLGSLSDDPNPTLSSDLDLNNFAITNSAGEVSLVGENSVRRAKASSANDFIEEEYIHSIILDDSMTDEPIVDLAFDYTQVEACEMLYKIKDSNGNIRCGSLKVVANENGTSLYDFDSVQTDTVDVTFTSELQIGEFAEFEGQVDGMTTDVVIRADRKGTIGNSVSLTFDGTDDIDTAISDWNTANPDNTVSLISGNGSQVPDDLEIIDLAGGLGEYAFFDGQVAGMTTDVTIEADNVGVNGNNISLSFDGIDDIDTAIATWNAANPSNTASLISGNGSQVPNNAEIINLAGGNNGSTIARILYTSGAETSEMRIDVKRIKA